MDGTVKNGTHSSTCNSDFWKGINEYEAFSFAKFPLNKKIIKVINDQNIHLRNVI